VIEDALEWNLKTLEIDTPDGNITQETREALVLCKQIREAVPVTEVDMAVYGGKDTQEARRIKHEAAKLLHTIMGDAN